MDIMATLSGKLLVFPFFFLTLSVSSQSQWRSAEGRVPHTFTDFSDKVTCGDWALYSSCHRLSPVFLRLPLGLAWRNTRCRKCGHSFDSGAATNDTKRMKNITLLARRFTTSVSFKHEKLHFLQEKVAPLLLQIDKNWSHWGITGGFLLTCEDFRRMFNHSLPALHFFGVFF